MSGSSTQSAQHGQALLLFSFGPVQPFIAAARKTADLWAGSVLLSHLARQALQPVCEECGEGAVIFPALDGSTDASDTDVSFPNRFVARVPEEGAEALAHQADRAVHKALQQQVDVALDRVGISEADGAPYEMAQRQADRFLETYWSILPLQEGDSHARRYQRLEQQLGARKALRDFRPLNEPGYRCDLMPDLAALVPRQDARPGAVRAFWREKAKGQPKSRLRDGEELSAVALAKRYYPEFRNETATAAETEAFPSTSSLATADFKADILQALCHNESNPALREAVTAYESAMEPLLGPAGAKEAPLPALDDLAEAAGIDLFHRIGGDWLFSETFDRFDEEESSLHAKTDRARNAASDLIQAARAEGMGAPSRYYALLLLDGDNMGKWLSGDQAPDGQTVNEAYHRAVSRALGRFAGHHVPRIVEQEYRGRLVYSGGDDVLAFVSLHDALPMARHLRAAFSGDLDDTGAIAWGQERAFTTDPQADDPVLGHKASASASLVMAHHMQPLDQVLDRARTTETFAKDGLGRDALACAIMKRSGEQVRAGGHWQSDDVDLVEVLRQYATFIRDGTVSTGYLYNIRADESTLETLPDDAIRSELRRIFRRQTGSGTDSDFAETVEALLRLLASQDSPLRTTTQLLTVAQFIGQRGTS